MTAPADADAGTEVAVVGDDRPADLRVVGDADVRAERRVLAEDDAGGDRAVVADDRRPVDDGRRVDRRPLAEPDAGTQREPLDLHLDPAVVDVLVGLEVRLGRADVLPVPLGDVPEDRPAGVEDGREDLAGEVDGAALGDEVEDLRLEHVDPGVDRVAEDLAPRRLLQEAFDRAALVGDDDPELQRVLDRAERQGGQGALLLVEVDDGREVDVGQDVTGDDEEPLVELLPGVEDRAGRAERRLLGGVDHADAELGPVAEVAADGVGHERDGDDDVGHPVLAQQADDVLHHRPVGHRQHRLRLVRRERPQTRPLAAGHDHCLHAPTSPPRSGPARSGPARSGPARSVPRRAARPSASAFRAGTR